MKWITKSRGSYETGRRAGFASFIFVMAVVMIIVVVIIMVVFFDTVMIVDLFFAWNIRRIICAIA
ncbi:hypothetical protein IE00_01755 [Paracoccus sp. SM22M-07]|nr:hypothetical protein IE00_01755 [Paracoccus sp. SM22M-07]